MSSFLGYLNDYSMSSFLGYLNDYSMSSFLGYLNDYSMSSFLGYLNDYSMSSFLGYLNDYSMSSFLGYLNDYCMSSFLGYFTTEMSVKSLQSSQLCNTKETSQSNLLRQCLLCGHMIKYNDKINRIHRILCFNICDFANML